MNEFECLWEEFVLRTPATIKAFEESPKLEGLCKMNFAMGVSTLVQKLLRTPQDKWEGTMIAIGSVAAREGTKLAESMLTQARMQNSGGGGAEPRGPGGDGVVHL